MISFLIGLMPGRAVLILGTFVLILGTAFGAGWKANGLRWEAKYTKAEAAYAAEQQLQAQAALEATNYYRTMQQDWANTKARLEKERDDERKALQERIAALSVTADGLRNAAAARARGGDPAADTVAACRADAAALRDILVEVEAAGRGMAEAAEHHAADVRLLLGAWPR